jgi:phenylalanyl-tRNA synthetase beta chain
MSGTQVRYPAMDFAASGAPIESEAALRIENAHLNPRFTAGLARGITLGPSPFVMQHRLKLVGQRPINNVVDISNYVMFEFGQPTHTFDFAAIHPAADGRRTVVTRLPHAGESIVTLDGKPRELQPNDILVCDETGPLSVAGVMGGADSEVKDSTRDVLFEVAAWHAKLRASTISAAKRHTASHAAFTRRWPCWRRSAACTCCSSMPAQRSHPASSTNIRCRRRSCASNCCPPASHA